jgi:formylglycine-generating enzyme
MLEPITATIGKTKAERGLIFAGEFQMGDSFDEGYADEKPVHTVTVDAFSIDVSPVTNARYREFIEATGYDEPRFWHDGQFNQPSQPTVGVSWYDASAYCQWAGGRLPTEAEWEKAARGGLVRKRFPWGNDAPDATRANFGFNIGGPTPVGQYPANGFGLYDMAGNVWQWCLDECQSDFYEQRNGGHNPFAGGEISVTVKNYTQIQKSRVVRGGSWGYSPNGLRVASRFFCVAPESQSTDIGFRCVVPQ